MTYAGINLIAVLAAAAAAMVFGLLWYSLVMVPRSGPVGSRAKDVFAKTRAMGFDGVVGALIAKTVMAFCLARLLVAFDSVSASNGVALALYLWTGFVATAIIVTHRFEHRRWQTTALDAAYWLVVLLIEGAIIGFIG